MTLLKKLFSRSEDRGASAVEYGLLIAGVAAIVLTAKLWWHRLLVMLGIRKRTPIGKILLGSTSQRVAIECPVPVVLVKPSTFVPPTRF